MEVKIEGGWKAQLKSEFESDYFYKLADFVREEYKSQLIYPPAEYLFNAFNCCPWDLVKVVVLGQDPYINPGQAHGLSFSVQDGTEIPPSLQNIFKEIESDLGIQIPPSGNLERWANQGVLLLNSVLTVRAGLSNSHQAKGWENFTDAVIRLISKHKKNIVFLLWGSQARKKIDLIDSRIHLVLESAHPSPLSVYRGFSGNKHFSKTNDYLQSKGISPINW